MVVRLDHSRTEGASTECSILPTARERRIGHPFGEPTPSPRSSPATGGVGCVDSPPDAPAAARVADRSRVQVEALWPSGAPGALGDSAEDQPSLVVYLPELADATGTGVIVVPGGGYDHLAMDHEGHQVARWLVDRGVAAFILRYRVGPRYRHPAPLDDARRAVRFVRRHARRFGIQVDRVGMWGFSAGGHLAGSAALYSERGSARAPDPVDRVSSRMDFLVLAYPVISMTEEYTHRGSRRNLLGAIPDGDSADRLSLERHVGPTVPPVFLFHTATDGTVPVENSLAFYGALQEEGIPARLHVFERGGHGVGLAQWDPLLSAWPGLAERWMADLGLLTASDQPPP